MAIAGVLTFWGTLAMLQTAVVLLMSGLLVWSVVVDIDRLRARSGWPKPLPFAALAAGVTANTAAFSFTGFAALLLGCFLLSAALVVALVRVLRRVGT